MYQRQTASSELVLVKAMNITLTAEKAELLAALEAANVLIADLQRQITDLERKEV